MYVMWSWFASYLNPTYYRGIVQKITIIKYKIISNLKLFDNESTKIKYKNVIDLEKIITHKASGGWYANDD